MSSLILSFCPEVPLLSQREQLINHVRRNVSLYILLSHWIWVVKIQAEMTAIPSNYKVCVACIIYTCGTNKLQAELERPNQLTTRSRVDLFLLQREQNQSDSPSFSFDILHSWFHRLRSILNYETFSHLEFSISSLKTSLNCSIMFPARDKITRDFVKSSRCDIEHETLFKRGQKLQSTILIEQLSS